jgi:signal transduction histidine kinase
MSINEFLALLTVPPGSLAYHLILLLALVAGLVMTYGRYRNTRTRSDRMMAAGLAAVLVLQLVPLFVAGLGEREASWALGAQRVFAAGALVWGIVLPSWGWAFGVRYSPAALGILVLGTAVLWPPGWIPLWPIFTALIYLAGAVAVLWQRDWDSWIGLVVALVLLGLAPLSSVIVLDSAAAAGVGRLITLCGYLALVGVLYRQTEAGWQAEWDALNVGLQSLSRDSLQQTQERLFLLQVSQTFSATLDLRARLDTAVESLALGGQVDQTVIALADEVDPDQLWIAASYNPLSRLQPQAERTRFSLKDYPPVAEAAGRREALILQPEESTAEILSLHKLLESDRIGPLLIQPLIHQEKLVGLVLLSNASSGRLFTDQDLKFCSALSSQITGAITNALLYMRVSRLLQDRATDASQRQAILESITDGVIATNKDGEIILVNPAAERILNREVRTLVGFPLAAICPMLWREGTSGYSSFEMNGRIIQGSMAPVWRPGGDQMGFVAVLRDVTQETQAERAKTSFIATVSHELRTPMTAIKGYADLMMAGIAGELSEEQFEYLNTILTNTERMVNIVNNMIAVSEMEGEIAFTPEIVEMEPLLRREIRALRPEIERRSHEFHFDCPTEIPPVLGDPLRLRQVVNNLLSNAVKYTPPGGRIEMRVRVLPPDVFTRDDRGYLVVAISDSGIGIPPEEQTRIFERFYRVDNPLSIQAGGPGVGLTIARELVERHGGRIWVDSKVDEGSTFTFIIPLAGRRL